uniref:YKR005C-like protein n=1 Tax=Schistosoma mansoni TaxID=6183 RepID=A0A5K4FD41_SCHMA
MAQYPDLNGPITFENNEKSVDEELKGQIQANELRITLLVEQTKRLRNALLVINDKRQNMNNNHNNEIQFMEENTELLSPKIDHSILSDDNNNNDDGDATSIIRPNSLSSLDNMSSDNRSVKEDNCRIRQKTYTKSNINSSEVNGNHPNVQLWSGPNTTRKGSSRPQSKKRK